MAISLRLATRSLVMGGMVPDECGRSRGLALQRARDLVAGSGRVPKVYRLARRERQGRSATAASAKTAIQPASAAAAQEAPAARQAWVCRPALVCRQVVALHRASAAWPSVWAVGGGEKIGRASGGE